jgi:hypothetical protein
VSRCSPGTELVVHRDTDVAMACGGLGVDQRDLRRARPV